MKRTGTRTLGTKEFETEPLSYYINDIRYYVEGGIFTFNDQHLLYATNLEIKKLDDGKLVPMTQEDEYIISEHLKRDPRTLEKLKLEEAIIDETFDIENLENQEYMNDIDLFGFDYLD